MGFDLDSRGTAKQILRHAADLESSSNRRGSAGLF
jgi:hypothetical protein